MKKLILSTILLGSIISFPSFAVEKKLNVPHFYQDDACWCGVATAEMVEDYYRDDWPWYSLRQSNLAKPQNNGGVEVGTLAESDSTNGKCGPKGGLDSAEMLTVLNTRVSPRISGRFVDVDNLIVTGSPKKNTYFHKWIMESIDDGDIFLFAGQTRYQDGTTSNSFSHWYVITGYKDADGDPYTIDWQDGYYIHDPAYGAGLSNVKPLDQKNKFVTHFNAIQYLASVNDRLYVVTLN